jgi:glycosyltransferase involved in cell wall biosynthesis
MSHQQALSPDNRQTPLVTFIVTTYNLPLPLLKQCLASILALSLQPSEREIIVVDDGSDSPVVSSLGSQLNDVTYIWQPNQGLSAARNAGISLAHGTYIQFVDGDDYLLKPAYEHCLELLRQHTPDMVMFEYTHHAQVHQQPTDDFYPSGTAYMRQHNIHATACGYLFRRKTMGALRFTPGIFHEDEEFTPLLLLSVDSLIHTSAAAYFYRVRNNSITQDKNPEVHQKRLTDFMSVISRLQSVADRIPSTDKLALQRRISQLSMDYIYNTMVLTRSASSVEACVEQLRSEGLFPLPSIRYTRNYRLFRLLSNSRMGRSLLTHLLPNNK